MPSIKNTVLHSLLRIAVLVLSSFPFITLGQVDAPGSIRVQLFEVTRLTASQTFHGGVNHFVWTYWYDGLGNLSFDTRICQQFASPTPVVFGINNQLIGPRLSSMARSEYIADPFNHTSSFGLQAWETGNSDPCVDHLNNIFWCNRDAELKQFRYIDRPPGITNVIRFARCIDFDLEYKFKYSVPKPIIKTQFSDIECGSGPLTLTAETAINGLVAFDSRYKFETVWEYRTASTPWLSIGVSGIYNAPTTPFSDISFPIRDLVGQITIATDVFYRVKNRMTLLQGNGIESAGDIFESEPTEIDAANITSTISLSPVPPAINSFSSTPSCSTPGSLTGIITVNVTGIGQGEYLYVLRAGTNQTALCDPEKNVTACFGIQSGRIHTDGSNNVDLLLPVAKGSYTLLVANKGGLTGVCSNFVNIEVGEVPPLQLLSPTIINVTCNGGSDGAVTLVAKDGKSPWSYSLARAGFNTVTNDTGVFTSLKAGVYTGSVTDVCGQPVIKNVVVNEPLKIIATINPLSLQCHSPSNGTLEVTITQGEGVYAYKLLKNNVSIATSDNMTASTWTINNLESGDYTMEIKDAARLQCDGSTSTFTLAEPPSFQIDPAPTALVKQNISCFGKNDGSIRLITPNSTQFNYILTNTISGQSSQSTTPNFSGLFPASYSLSMKRNIPGCNDINTYPTRIEIIQPDEIVVSLTIKNVSCFGTGDGSIVASVQGAIGLVQYVWEVNINGGWSTLANTTSSLTNLSGGTFRLKLTNANGCSSELKEAVVLEPALLSFSNVIVHDIKCIGDQGQVDIEMTGGIGPYSYTYSSAADIIQSATFTTAVTEGIYSLVATDKNSCQATYGNTVSITAPPVSLQFDYTLSDFSGYNIRCTGANNAFAQLVAIGGNGGNYTGYTYALDGNFQANSKIENITPGAHTLSVKDSRGCSASKSISITEPSSELKSILLKKTDVTCFGDATGQLSISALGGLTPYTFQLKDNTQQGKEGIFTNLTPGPYTILIKDKNGCTSEYTDEVLLLIKPIVITSHINNENCNGGKSGSIQLELEGGDQPLILQWGNGLGQLSTVSDLPAGDYTFKAIDQQGCTINKIFTITEPDVLTLRVTPTPVCVGKATGKLTVQAKGGTTPFNYSINQGATYGANAVFADLGPGTYAVMVQDEKKCQVTASAEIIVRNDLPEPNFIVASAQNALDSLVINEISFPKPDSIEWKFDPGITVTNDDVWAPEIIIKESGDYTIAMKGYFGGCDYTKTVTLTIKPYDPESRRPINLSIESIRQVDVSPNPNEGEFKVRVDLNLKQYVSIRVVDVLGITHFNKKWDRTQQVDENIKLDNATSGIYILQVITDTGAVEKRIIINH